MSSHASDYAQVIAQEVTDLDVALSDARRYECGDGEAPVFDSDTFEDATEVMHYYVNTCALEVVDVTARSWATYERYGDRRYVEVLRTLGGPNAYVRFYENGVVRVRVYWGTDEATRNVYAPLAAEHLWALADVLAECSV
jgi:hypothetical protein